MGKRVEAMTRRSVDFSLMHGLAYTDEERAQIAVRYLEVAEQLLGYPLELDMRSWEERVVDGLEKAVEQMVARR